MCDRIENAEVDVVEAEEEIVCSKGRRGQTMTEYAIIVALIALACIGVVYALGDKVKTIFSETTDALDDPSSVAP